MKMPLQLTEEQKEAIDSRGQEIKDLSELTREVFMDETLDGRTREGRAVRAYLAEKEINYQTRHVSKKSDIILSEEQKEFIRNNASPGMSSIE